MAYKFQKELAIMSGSLDQEGDIDIIGSGVLKVAGTTAIDSSRNAAFATISGSGIAVTSGMSASGFVDIKQDKLRISSVPVTTTAAELNILDGVTATTSELNIMDGVTATTSELNIMDGVTATTSELNIMDGVTATTSELNILDGVSASTAELNHLVGSDANLASFVLPASTTISNFGKSLVDDASAADARTTLGLGSMATQAKNSVDIDGGAIDGTVIGGTAVANASVDNFVAASAKITDLSANRVVFCNNNDGELVDSANLTFDGADLSVTGRVIAVDVSGSGELSMGAVSGTLEYSLTPVSNSGLSLDPAGYNNSAARTIGVDLVSLPAATGGGAIDATADSLAFIDDSDGADATKKTTVALLMTSVANLANNGIAASSGQLKFDGYNLADIGGDLDPAADFMFFADESDAANASKKISLQDFCNSIAGAGLSATGGQLVADAATTVNAFADNNPFVEGYNIQTDTATRSKAMPAGTVGDVVTVKAGDLGEGNTLTITAVSGKQIDGESSIVLESPFAAISMVYVSDSIGWRIL